MTTTLTTLEQKVYDALKQNALACSGGDFACAEEVDTKALKITKQQFGALLTTLEAKRVISVDISYVNGSFRSKGTKVTQVTAYDAAGSNAFAQ
jgi:hypothetical protein